MRSFYQTAAVLAAFALFSCEKNIWKETYEPIIPSETAVTQVSGCEAVAQEYYANLGDIIKATALDGPVTRAAAIRGNGDAARFYLDNAADYPVHAKLAGLDIETEDGTKINFFDLPAGQKEPFVDKLMETGTKDLTDKIRQVSGMRQYYAGQNKVVSDNLKAYRTKAGGLVIDDPRAFFAAVSRDLEDLAARYSFETPDTRGSTQSDPNITADYVVDKIRNIAKKGDVILTLPNNKNPLSIVDFGKDNMFMFGHAGIFYDDITSKTRRYHFTTIESLMEYGVNYSMLEHWDCECYVVGLCNRTYKWVWRGFKSHMETIKTPVENPGLLTAEAKKHVGKEYVRWYEFLTAKWSAPARFTCTTLVWFCAKEQYGIDLSSWLSPLVTPSEILGSDYTDIKVHVK